MPVLKLYSKEGQFVADAILEINQPDIIFFQDRLYILNPAFSQYREAYLVTATREEDKFFCHVPPIEPKDRCLKCTTLIDPESGKRYCDKHAIGVCSEHQTVDCIHCGFNRESPEYGQKK